MPRVKILNGRGDLKTTANYNYTSEEKVVKINGKNRATVDIMRSIAHELTHHKQFEDNRLKVRPKNIGGEIEDEANAFAGQFIKLYAKKNPDIYIIDEQEDMSSQNTKTTSYPEVTKWSDIVGSKISRGPANPLSVGKWSDTYKINRDGPANQLK